MRIKNNKKIKFFASLICLTALVSSVNTTTFASTLPEGHKNEIKQLMNMGFNKSDEQTLNNLLNVGFDLDQIKNLPSSEFQKFKGQDFKLVSKTSKYCRITTDEKNLTNRVQEFNEENYFNQYLKDMQASTNKMLGAQLNSVSTTPGINDASWMKLDTEIYYSSSNNQYTLYNFFTWKKDPVRRLEDVLGIGVSSQFSPISNSEFFSYSADYRYTSPGQSGGTDYIKKSVHDNVGIGGMAFKFKLFETLSTNKGAKIYSNHKGYMYFRCKLNLNYGSPTYANAYGSYNHQDTNWQISPTINIPFGGSIGISSQDKFTPLDTNAQVTAQ